MPTVEMPDTYVSIMDEDLPMLDHTDLDQTDLYHLFDQTDVTYSWEEIQDLATSFPEFDNFKLAEDNGVGLPVPAPPCAVVVDAARDAPTLAHTPLSQEMFLMPPASPGNLLQPASPGTMLQPASPGRLLQPASPGFLMQPASPGFLMQPASPGFLMQPASPGFLMQPASPGFLMQPASPGTLLQPASPGFLMQPASPGFVMQPASPGTSMDSTLTYSSQSYSLDPEYLQPVKPEQSCVVTLRSLPYPPEPTLMQVGQQQQQQPLREPTLSLSSTVSVQQESSAAQSCGEAAAAPKKRGRRPKYPNGAAPRRIRLKKPKVYEISESLEDPTAEKKRKNAINAKRHRDMQKQERDDLALQLEAIVTERDDLLQKVKQLEQSHALLQQRLAHAECQGFVLM